jgi:glycosyltransferase involved in cell wall biosynthesis
LSAQARALQGRLAAVGEAVRVVEFGADGPHEAQQWLADGQPDLVHFFFSDRLLSGIKAAADDWRAPVVTTISRAALEAVPRAELTVPSYFPRGRVVAVSEDVQGALAGAGVEAQAISWGCDTARFAPSERCGSRDTMDTRVLCIVDAGELANALIVLEAMARLSGGRRISMAALAFDERQREQLAARIAAMKLQADVRLVEPRGDLLGAYQSADIFAATAPDATPELLEAMACGLAVIAPEGPTTNQIVVGGINGMLYPPGDSAALSFGLLELAGAPVMRQTYGEQARRTIEENYSMEQIAEEYLEVYRSVLTG